MAEILLVEIIVDIALSCILIFLMIEVFGFQKVLQKSGIKFVINLCDTLSKNQLTKIVDLLESENRDYKTQSRRIIIYGYRWQYLFFYFIRIFLLIFSRSMS